jgi:N-acyl-D-amino-acid deacylase
VAIVLMRLLQIGSTSHPDLAALSGRRLGEVARSSNSPPIQVFFDILQKDRLSTSCIMHIGNEENVQEILKHEVHCAGSDAILHGKSTHPRVSRREARGGRGAAR